MPSLEINIGEGDWTRLQLLAVDGETTPEDIIETEVQRLVLTRGLRWQGRELLVILHEMALTVGDLAETGRVRERWRARHSHANDMEINKGFAQLTLNGFVEVTDVGVFRIAKAFLPENIGS